MRLFGLILILLMNPDTKCILIFDPDLHLLFRSGNPLFSEPLENTFLYKENKLIGFRGVPDLIFREVMIEAVRAGSTFFLRPKKRHRLKQELFIDISPLYGKSPLNTHSGLSYICFYVQTVDIYYSTSTKRLADKFDLTPTERIVLSHLLNGKTSGEIKEEMDIGEPTLRSHQQRILSKFGENSVTKTLLSALKIENNVDKVIEMDD